MEASVTSGELTAAQPPQIQLANVLRIPAVRQLSLLIGVAMAVAAGFAVVLWSQTPNYSQLYKGLEERDAAAVVDALTGAGVDFEVNRATGAIMVRADQVHSARIQLASQGLPQTSAIGMDSVGDQSSFGVSQFMETARYQHALEAELSRTIKSLRVVQEARVHLAIPKQSAFIRDKQKPTASVLLHLYGGQQLESGQSSSIINLVASSIPGMAATDVTLIDQFGRLLSVKEMDDSALSANQFKYTRALEQSFSQRIEQLLTPLLGAGSVRAEVVADLDFTIVEETRESFDPASQVIRSEQVSEEQRAAGDNGPEGVPGALSNTPPEAGGVINPDGTVAATSVNSSRRATRNFEMDKTISRTRAPTGEIRKLSVAVLIDETSVTDGEPLTEAELERITALVREAVGFNVERGDTVEVLSAPFRQLPEAEPVEGPALWEQPAVREMGKQGLGVVLALVLGFGVVRPMLKSIVAPAPGGLNQLLPSANSSDGVSPGQLEAPGGAGSGLSYQEKVAAARNITGHDPARVAQVVRKWIDNDGS